MTELSLNVDPILQKINQSLAETPEQRQQLLSKIGMIIERNVKELVRLRASDTGQYLNSIHYTITSPTTVVISDGIFYGIYLELGTGIYGPKHTLIKPTSKKALAFTVKTFKARPGGGATKHEQKVVVKYVRGIKPKHIWRDALKNSLPEIIAAVREHYTNIAKKAF